ncbi:MAG: hypothetical protein NT023_23900, partial [Armatimonadetes bacterium]|nr:hypothetical protein [Armatimonadota bacterium]
IGARYGTPGPEGISYTEMEYRYATEKRKPTLAFLHKDPGSIPRDKTDGNDEKWQKLGAFRNLAQEKMCKYWTSPADLGGVVSRSLVQLKKTTSAVGWVRANELADPEVYAENTRLRKKIEELEADLATLAMRGPENVEKLAQGEEKYMLEFNVIYFDVMYIDGGYCPSYETVLIPLTWNEIMAAVLPLFQVGGSAIEVKPVLESLIVRLIDRTNLREVYADLDQFRISVYNGEICVVLST